MAVSEASIAQLALQHLGERFDLTSLADATPEAEQVSLVFDTVRDGLLREHPWKFARKYSKPTYIDVDLYPNSGGVPGNWDYMFLYPSDCLRMLRIVNPLGDDQPAIRFERGRWTAVGDPPTSGDPTYKVILTSVEEPTFEYTEAITDPTEFDPVFVTAFAYRLAQYIAMPLTGSAEMVGQMKVLADREVGMASSIDGNEGYDVPQPADATWITARA